MTLRMTILGVYPLRRITAGTHPLRRLPAPASPDSWTRRATSRWTALSTATAGTQGCSGSPTTPGAHPRRPATCWDRPAARRSTAPAPRPTPSSATSCSRGPNWSWRGHRHAARALDLDYFAGLDSIIATGIGAIQELLITPWIGLPLVLLGLVLLGLARRGEASESAQRLGIAMVGLLIIAFLGNYPLAAAGAADKAIVDLQQQFDQGFLAKLPESVTPTVTYCLYDFSQFDQPPAWDDNGYQLIAGTACTITYRPTMNPADTFSTSEDGVIQNYSPTYFEDFYYSEVMVDNMIFPYWQQGLLGTDDRTGPNYELPNHFCAVRASPNSSRPTTTTTPRQQPRPRSEPCTALSTTTSRSAVVPKRPAPRGGS